MPKIQVDDIVNKSDNGANGGSGIVIIAYPS
jgi:hypothetical protein